jgi:dephospho-CoA kinase
MGSKIIGLCGLIGSGKGTVANELWQTYGYQPRSFANALKDGVASLFGSDRKTL